MKDVKIIATDFAVPDHVVTNDDLSKIMDTSDEWISKRTGIKRRHISQKENTSDLASQVADSLLKQANLDAEAIDLIVVATMSPDNLTPATAAMVQGKIGAKRAICFDISAACSGFSYAVAVAQSMLLVNDWEYAIVIGAEVLSKLLDWHDRSTAVLFGDGAGGVLLKKTAHPHLLGKALETFGDKGNQLIAGHLGLTNKEVSPFKMNGQEVYRFTTHEVPRSILKASANAEISLDQIDHFLLHQANRRIIVQVAKKLKQPLTKFPINIDEYGNTAAASEAILLAEMVQKGKIKRGNIVALSGFGGGLT
ncbi:MAG: ketoacyl-ACP synthase III, partial [Lactobacillus sp.]|nr:ketoacyl-ACP synthase III [Lactobacillus sp.]